MKRIGGGMHARALMSRVVQIIPLILDHEKHRSTMHRRLTLKTSSWSIAALLSFCIIATNPLEAFACVAPGSTRTFLFPDIPAGIQAPVIAQITVTSLLESSWKNKRRAWFTKRRSFKGLAHVDHVIKGAIGTKLIKIIAPDRAVIAHSRWEIPAS
jgi:hypothetical protein